MANVADRPTRSSIPHLGALTCLLLVATAAISGCTVPKLATRDIMRSFGPDAHIEQLAVRDPQGSIYIHSSDAHGIIVLARVRAWGPDQKTADARANGIKLDVQQNNNELDVQPSLPQDLSGYSVDLDITVPRALLAARLDATRGDIEVQADFPQLIANANDGSISARLDRWQGHSSLTTSDGNISVSGRFTSAGPIDFDARHGYIHLSLDWPSDAHVVATSFGGSVTLVKGFFDDTRIYSRTPHNLVLGVGAGIADVSATAANGDIVIQSGK